MPRGSCPFSRTKASEQSGLKSFAANESGNQSLVGFDDRFGSFCQEAKTIQNTL
jgi:hypothetical protein